MSEPYTKYSFSLPVWLLAQLQREVAESRRGSLSAYICEILIDSGGIPETKADSKKKSAKVK